MIKIHRIRQGFANNSSSSHSILILTQGSMKTSKYEKGGNFGWEDFVLADAESKKQYLAALVRESLTESLDLDSPTVSGILEQLLGISGLTEDGYIDHQSELGFPRNRDGSINLKFLMDFKDFLCRDDVVILGGNDNGGSMQVPDNVLTKTLSYTESYDAADFMQAYKTGDFWTLFNPRSGSKLTFSFLENPNPFIRSDFPELVDVKITDFCPFGCPMCYMGSTEAGKHADLDTIKGIAAMLANQGTFEVALGGGEPTLHPQFKEILQVFRTHGIVPNVTTRNLPWLTKLVKDKETRCLLGGVAISIDDLREQNRIEAIMSQFNIWGESTDDEVVSISIQVIMGVFPAEQFPSLVSMVSYKGRLTLLGYKYTGRGSEYHPRTIPEDWIRQVTPLMRGRSCVAIDTVFAAQQKETLQTAGILRESFHTLDGVTSCFIDAVNKSAAPSSYDTLGENVYPLDLDNKTCLEGFKIWWSSLPLTEE